MSTKKQLQSLMQMENFQLCKTNDIVFVSKEHQSKKKQLTLNYSQMTN
jgi:hypothetical protein